MRKIRMIGIVTLTILRLAGWGKKEAKVIETEPIETVMIEIESYRKIFKKVEK
jgi:hypothetical protein